MTSTLETTRGILTIAHTKEKYIRQAINLALSIRLRSPEIPLAVATNLNSNTFNHVFDVIIPWDFSKLPGLVAKLDAYAMSPFEETLFIDADCLVLKPLEPVFKYFQDQDFSVFGINTPHPDWFTDIDQIKKSVPSETYPGFNGGVYYFKKTSLAKQIFASAIATLPDYDRLKIARFGAYPNEEPLISLAMARFGVLATDDDRLEVMCAPARILGRLQIDVLAGKCSFNKYGCIVSPSIMHFASDDDCYEYFREELRLRASLNGKSVGRCQEIYFRARAWGKAMVIKVLPLYFLIFRNKLTKLLKRSTEATHQPKG